MRYINQIKKQVTHVESLAGAVNLAILKAIINNNSNSKPLWPSGKALNW